MFPPGGLKGKTLMEIILNIYIFFSLQKFSLDQFHSFLSLFNKHTHWPLDFFLRVNNKLKSFG